MNVAPGSSYEAVVDWGVTGLVGTLGLRVLDNEGNEVVARLTAGFIEEPAGSGVYARAGNVAPTGRGQYTLFYDDGSVSPGHVATDELVVTFSATSPPEPGPPGGPLCAAWIDGAAVEACGPTLTSNPADLDDAAYDASWILYELTGRRYPGGCTDTVRPCRTSCSCGWGGYAAGVGGPSWNWSWGPGGWWWRDENAAGRCGCGAESRVRLAGWATEILEVKIGGVVLPALDGDGNRNWRLDGHEWLTRMDDPGPPLVKRLWPACQNLSLDDDQPGTFSVAYRWGAAPPTLGTLAAAQLARELWNACVPGGTGACALDGRVTKIVRQGVTIDRVQSIAALLRKGETGVALLDAFIAADPGAKGGPSQPPMVWSPDVQGYARRLG